MNANRMRVSNIVEFYYLELLSFLSSQESSRNVKAGVKFRSDLATVRAKFESDLSQALHDYIVLACLGESRHASGRAESMFNEIHDCDREDACRDGLDFSPRKALESCIVLFNEVDWYSTGFGGPRWGDIATAGLMFYKPEINTTTFIDYIIDVYHNGGSLFDKGAAGRLARLTLDVTRHAIMEFLDYKRDYDILDDAMMSNEYILPLVQSSLSSMVTSLIHRYYVIYREEYPPTWVSQCDGKSTYNYTPPSWGDDTLTIVDSQLTWECDCCGGEFYQYHDSRYTDNHGNYPVCSTCRRDSYKLTCSQCGDAYNEDDLYTVEDELYCYDCKSELTLCYDCDADIEDEEHITDSDGDTICIPCALERDLVKLCEICGTVIDNLEGDALDHCAKCIQWDGIPHLDRTPGNLTFLDYALHLPYHAGKGYNYKNKVKASWAVATSKDYGRIIPLHWETKVDYSVQYSHYTDKTRTWYTYNTFDSERLANYSLEVFYRNKHNDVRVRLVKVALNADNTITRRVIRSMSYKMGESTDTTNRSQS